MSGQASDFERRLVERMVAAAGTDAGKTETDIQASEYDWSVPHRMTPARRKGLQTLAERAAESAGDRLAGLLRTDVKLAVVSVSEQYAAALSEAELTAHACDLRAGDDCAGALALGETQTRTWVTRLLGGEAAAPDEAADLSDLEQTLLTDLLAALADGLAPLVASRDRSVRPGEKLVRGSWPVRAEPGAAWVCVDLGLQGEQDPEPVIHLAVPGDAAVAAVSDGADDGDDASEQAEASHRLQRVRLPVTVRLAALASMRDVLGLAEGDVLVTEHRTDDVLGVRVGGQRVLAGRPVRAGGHYAVEIASEPTE